MKQQGVARIARTHRLDVAEHVGEFCFKAGLGLVAGIPVETRAETLPPAGARRPTSTGGLAADLRR
jgi:hypothetical protein